MIYCGKVTGKHGRNKEEKGVMAMNEGEKRCIKKERKEER